MRYLGLDPASIVLGWGVIDVYPGTKKLVLVAYGTVEAAKGKAFPERLQIMHDGVAKVIKKYSPDACGIEEAFSGINLKTAIKLGHVRGVVLLALRHAGVAIHEYAPRLIKQSVTGNGNAEKSLVQEMVKSILKLKTAPEPYDASDALATAICHHHHAASAALLAGASKGRGAAAAKATKAGRRAGSKAASTGLSLRGGRRGSVRVSSGGLAQLLKRPGVRIAAHDGRRK